MPPTPTAPTAPSSPHDALIAQCREAGEAAIAGDIKRGLALAQEARNRARAAGDAVAELAAVNAAARCHGLRHDAIAALAAGIDAAGLARRLDDRVALAQALISVANTAFSFQLLEPAVPLVTRAIDCAVELGLAELEVRGRHVLGMILGDLKQFDAARAELDQGLAMARREGLEAFACRLAANIAAASRKEARHLFESGRQEAAEARAADAWREADAAMPQVKAQGNRLVESNLMGLYGELSRIRGDLDGAITATRRAIELARAVSNPAPLMPWHQRLAEIHLERGDQLNARIELLSGLEVAEMLRPSFRIGDLCECLAQLEEDAGDAEAAARMRRRAHEERESFNRARDDAAAWIRGLEAAITTTPA